MSIKRSNKIQWKQYPIAWFYLLGGIAILLIVGVVSKLKTNEEDIETKEKEWYVQQLNYNFCAAVTSVEPLKQKWGYGYIICDLDSTVAVDITKEDSLQQFLKTNKHIRFIVSTSRGKVKLLVPGVFEWRKMTRYVLMHGIKK